MRAVEQELQSVLEERVKQEQVLGLALVSRDGLPVLSAYSDDFNTANFSLLIQGAMIATLMGAAEVALGEVAGGQTRRVVAEAEGLTMIVMAASDELLLVGLAKAGSDLSALLPGIEEVLQTIQQSLQGG